MNNQAAQTMPLPPYLPEWSRMDNLGGVVPSEVRQALIAMYQRGYAAALSQTAGVAEGMVLLPRDQLEGIVERLSVGMESFVRKESDTLHDLLAAAPAASGGERVPLSERLYRGPAHDPSGSERGLEPQATSESMPPSAASVSERARELLAAECGVSPEMVNEYQDRDAIVRAALRALEKSITQRLGNVSWSALQIGNRGAAFDPPCSRRAYTYQHQPGNLEAHRLGGALATAADATYGDNIDRGLSLLKALEYVGFGVFQIGIPTPQPSADAVRELVKRILDWQPLTSINKADRLYQILVAAGLPFESVTDELESLLGRGA